jgi:WS/DGAT/MGAT family acyltransferase
MLRMPWQLGSALGRLVRDEDDARHHFAERARALGRLALDAGGGAPTPVPFNRPIGPHRRVDWLPLPMAQIREIRDAVGGTVNDVVLATAAGAIGRFLSRVRGVDLAPVRFRAMTPVSVRTPDQQGTLGNRVSAWTVDLPIAEGDALARLESVRRSTRDLKEKKSALGAETLTQASEWTGSALLSLGARLMNLGTPFNLVITNVPGPRTRLHLLESRLLEIHPHVPLLGTLGLGIALFSYDGALSWGYSADWDLVPDLHELVQATQRSFAELHAAATARKSES